MHEDHNRSFDRKIKKLRKVSAVLGGVGVLLLLLILILDISYPDILFSIMGAISLALVFVSAGIYIAAWAMEMHSAYKKKEYLLLLLLFFVGIVFLFVLIFRNR